MEEKRTNQSCKLYQIIGAYALTLVELSRDR
jgi:hypothetical protein